MGEERGGVAKPTEVARVARSLKSVGPNATLVADDLEAVILPIQSARRPSNCIKSDGVERPFEPASKVPNVVA